ncbi:MAG: ATP-binding cassette domain-containing protein [Clostridia bacterium]|nr:ATP-binding cassette domain-containing protein [Clostridia bacterium]
MQLVRDKYQPQIEAAGTEDEQKRLQSQMKEELRLASKDRIMNKMQMIFQDPIASLNPRMTVREIIAEGLIIRGIRDKKLIDEKVYEVLDLVGLVPEHAGRYPHEFSGGQRQRIGIARAIILQPDLIIADEPISALDVSIQAQVINLLNELRERLGLTILFIAHDLSVVKYFSDRIAVMYFGKIVELTTSDELFKHPLHPYTKSLLSAIPLPDPRFEKQRKRIAYNPLASHDYSEQQPYMQEVVEGHFIYCNDAELEKYKAEIAELDAKAAKLEAEKAAEEQKATKKTTAKKSTVAKDKSTVATKSKSTTAKKATSATNKTSTASKSSKSTESKSTAKSATKSTVAKTSASTKSKSSSAKTSAKK